MATIRAKTRSGRFPWTPLLALACFWTASVGNVARAAEFRLGTFAADITIPLNHRCMGVLPTKSKKVVDRLYAHGLVLTGSEQPVVVVALDWCEVRNGAYDQWREAIAAAAGTSRERILLSSLHQHDAPVTDRGAAGLLVEAGLPGELYDETFHEETIKRVAAAVKLCLAETIPVSHFGVSEAKVERIASNRRIVDDQGRVSFSRGSRSGGNEFHAKAPGGLIDPFLKTVSFWNKQKRVAELHAYATHPMSYYGRGEVTSDFVGLARERRQRDDRTVKQIYVSGCSGDVTAGKYNTGSHDDRLALTQRLYDAMVASSKNVKLHPLESLSFRSTELRLPFHPKAGLTEASLRRQLANKELSVEKRILAAMGLSSRLRVAKDQPIDFPCIDLGAAQVVLFPAEAFVGYQRMAQAMRPDSFVLSIGYGECWPGYIPTDSAFDDQFDDSWLWVGRESEAEIRDALQTILRPAGKD